MYNMYLKASFHLALYIYPGYPNCNNIIAVLLIYNILKRVINLNII